MFLVSYYPYEVRYARPRGDLVMPAKHYRAELRQRGKRNTEQSTSQKHVDIVQTWPSVSSGVHRLARGAAGGNAPDLTRML